MAEKKMMRKGSKVEVSSDEPGFYGAWYVATLVDILDETPIKNNNKKTPKKRLHKNKTGYLVKYDTLFEEENADEHLCEMVEPKFIRPLPPPMADVEEFKVDDVIDAYHRDGWWIGVIVKKVSGTKYLVRFENPTEEFEFEKELLRFHVDWVDSCWNVLASKKTQEHESVDIHTSESNNDVPPSFTTPSGAAKPTDLENPSTRSATKRTRLQQTTESNSEIYLRKTRSRTVNSVEENSRSQASAGGKKKKTVEVPVMERSGSQALTTETSEGQSQERTTKGRRLLLEVTSPNFECSRDICSLMADSFQENSKTHDGQMVNSLQEGNQNASNGDSSAFKMQHISDDAPLSIWCQGLRPHSVLNRSSCKNRNLPDSHERSSGAPMPLSQPIVSNGGTKVWPFVKKSFFWGTIESMESLQMQKPHFSPLKKMKEGCREGYAIGHMVTFENIIRDVLNYQPTSPIDKINNSLELLDELEPHGFDVSAVKDRLNTFLSSKVKVGDLENELKKFENDIEICNVEKRAAEEELNELKLKIQKLQEVKAVKDEDIKRLKSNVDLVADQITEAELAIEKLAAKPL